MKILMNLTHPNVVRVFDYYLYPEELTGFLQMEYIDGVPINEFDCGSPRKGWNEVFSDIVSAFEAMEANGILHRDIRAANILVNNEGAVKVIDFGFGKQNYSDVGETPNSVILNWPASEPDEIASGVYNHGTEVYYLGKLMRGLVAGDERFEYYPVIDRMSEKDPSRRYQSFSEVRSAMGGAILQGDLFKPEEKQLYQEFARSLVGAIAELRAPACPIGNPDAVLASLKNLLGCSLLESVIQGNNHLINCFIVNEYEYFAYEIPVDLVCRFYQFFAGLSENGRKIVLQNISRRFEGVKVVYDYDEDIPF